MQFKNVIGHTLLKKQLVDEINSGKISHAQLFAGKNGFGSLALALAYTQFLYCENKQQSDSCGVCSSCMKNEKLQYADVHFIYPVVQAIDKTSDTFVQKWRDLVIENPYFDIGNWVETIDPSKLRSPIIGVEESNNILRKLSLTSYEGSFKVVIIWLPELMNVQSANKLLKILEEPSKDTIFILISENTDALLQTILSRTQIKRIPSINLDDLSLHLAQKHQIPNQEAYAAASLAEGNLIQAEANLSSNKELTYNRDMFIQLMRVCYKKIPTDMMDWADKISELSKDKLKLFVDYSLHMFRQSLLKNYTENQLTKVSQEEDEFLSKFAQFITGNNIYDLMDDFNNASYYIDRNANVRILFTELCFRVMRNLHKA